MLFRQRMLAGSMVLGLLFNLCFAIVAFTGSPWFALMLLVTYGIGAFMVPRLDETPQEETQKTKAQAAPKVSAPTTSAVESEVWDVLKQLGYQATEAKRVFREASMAYPEMDSEQLVHSILQARGRRKR